MIFSARILSFLAASIPFYAHCAVSEGGFQVDAPVPRCKCVPEDQCWPSHLTWQALNDELGGRLIPTKPVAKACHDGLIKNDTDCARITKLWSNQNFQHDNTVGRQFPWNNTCAPIDPYTGETSANCSIGSLPVYAVNATEPAHIRSALRFARLHNIRTIVVSTGHDQLGRSDGYGSLEIWLRYYRNSIDFQPRYAAAIECARSNWTGSAIRIDGVYQWRDVNVVARRENVIVVGGGALGPGAIGGWASGGGLGPATRNYGLGADQILEAQVMLADGRIVLANHCENTDLFRALRGGGPGYGAVLGTTVKAHPNVDVITAHRLAIAPLHKVPRNPDLLGAVSVMLQHFANLNDAGFAGYAYWFRSFPVVFVGNATSGYSHGFWAIGKTREEAEAGFAPVRAAIAPFKELLWINETWTTYPDYWSFYDVESGLNDPVGQTTLVSSRLIDRPATTNYKHVREAVEVLSGQDEEYTANVVHLLSGGQVFKEAQDPTSGLNPAWRRSHFVLGTTRGVPITVTGADRMEVAYDVTFVKGIAAKKLAPDTGAYMNLGDRNDPDYIKNFYGDKYGSHLAAKRRYDPLDIFYCPTCVGAERFSDRQDGSLCKKV